MRRGLIGFLLGGALCAHACSGGGLGGASPDDGLGGEPIGNDFGGSESTGSDASFEGTAGGSDMPTAPTGNVGGSTGAPDDPCVAQATQSVSTPCAQCACGGGGGCRARIEACGPACWALLACVQLECGGRTDDAECILAQCDVSDAEAAYRAGSCVSRCPDECADDLADIARPPDGGPPDGGAAADQCPGEAITLAASAPTTSVQGSTLGARDDYQSYCAKDGAGAGEAVYGVTVEQAGTLTIAVSSTSASFDGVLYVESTCGEAPSTIACTDRDGYLENVAVPVDAGGTVYAVVESRAGGEGPFWVDFAVAPAACGDGAVNAGEQCDFGDVSPGDGCDANCQFEAPADASDVCPGEVDTLIAGTPKTLSSFTVGYSDSYDAPCGAETGAPDRVFAFNPQANGTLTVDLSSSFDGVLSIYETCNVPNLFDLRLCSDSPRASADESISIEVIGGEQYFIVVDGYRKSSMGTFQLTVELTP